MRRSKFQRLHMTWWSICFQQPIKRVVDNVYSYVCTCVVVWGINIIRRYISMFSFHIYIHNPLIVKYQHPSGSIKRRERIRIGCIVYNLASSESSFIRPNQNETAYIRSFAQFMRICLDASKFNRMQEINMNWIL